MTHIRGRQTAAVGLGRRRTLFATLALAAWGFGGFAVADTSRDVVVWKSPTCGCCNDWIAHMRKNGFKVATRDVDDTVAVRARLGMPETQASCHTATVDGYVIEGHVPAREIQRLLRERPRALGLSVPGMVIGSPGMDTPAYGGRKDPYDVLMVQRTGATQVFASYR